MSLPPDLVVTRKRRGKIYAAYATEEHLSLAITLLSVYEEHLKKTRGELKEALADCEMLGFSYKLVRGIAYLIEGFIEFESRAVINPMKARISVFKTVGKKIINSVEERKKLLSAVAFKNNISTFDLERSLYGDLDDEQELSSFKKPEPILLLKQYNFNLALSILVNAKNLRIQYKEFDNSLERQSRDLGEVTVLSVNDTREILIEIKSRSKNTIVKNLNKVLTLLLKKKIWSISSEVLDPFSPHKVYDFSLSHDVEGIMMESKKTNSKNKLIENRDIVRKKEPEIVDIELEVRKLGDTEKKIKALYSGKGYVDLGELLVTPEKLESIKSKIEGAENMLFNTLKQILQREGVKNPVLMLESLGYLIEWNRDRDHSLVYRVNSSKS